MTHPPRSDLASHWRLDPQVVFLNHGSFGATPREVLDVQAQLRERLEAEPVRFLARELETLMDESRRAVARFVGADAEELAFVGNATVGVNAVLQSMRLEPGDEILTTDHGYNACQNAAHEVALRRGARRTVARVPFPIRDEQQMIDAVLAAVTPRTRLALIDHITSPTALVFPVERLVSAFHARGIRVLIDGAHGPGMLPLDLKKLGADYYVGNCHKWLCSPKGVAFLWVPRPLQPEVRPVVISHGANSTRTDRSRFQVEFDWIGTQDPTPALSVPTAIETIGRLMPGGWPEIMKRNREMAIAGRKVLLGALNQPAPAPESMLGSMASVVLPDAQQAPSAAASYRDPIQDQLFERHHIEVPVSLWPSAPHRVLRIATHLYNSLAEVEYLASVLPGELQPRS